MGPEEHIYWIIFEATYKDEKGDEYVDNDRVLLRAESRHLGQISKVFYEWLNSHIEGNSHTPDRQLQTADIEKIEYVGVVEAGG